jgi:OPA family glycerol-3-phosphate transporter-like MFS transporter/OPA family sugar phosphate sensor protein UhpC-like MFS transporter
MDAQLKKKYTYWQWRTLIVLMIGYILYYFVRKNFSAAIPAMEAELGITKLQLGTFLTINGIVYGLSRFANGFLADRLSRKKLMATGLALSAMLNFAICFSPSLNGFVNVLDTDGKATMTLVYIIGSLWVLNGYVHGMGFPPCASLMAHWFRPSELATKQSIWNASHSIGAGIVVAMCGALLSAFGMSAWNLCFAIPGAIALVGCVLLLVGLRDTPSSVGLPEIEDLEKEESGIKVETRKEEELKGEAYNKFLSKMVFKNPIIWILALTNFCVYVIRFTILDWGTSFLTQYKGFDIALSSSIVASSELIGGVAGTLIAGWFTDKYLKSKAQRTCLIGVVGATVCFLGFWQMPNTVHWFISAFLICMSGFFIYAPQALPGVAASQQATKRVCATANGILGIFGYAATTVAGIGFGFIADKFGWNSVFIVAIIFGIIGSLVIATIWNAPADGYEKAEKVLADIKK